MPDSSSKSGSPRQPSSRPPFSGDWPGIRFSSWNAGFQLEKRIPKTTFITAPLFRRLAGDPLFELDSSSKSGSPRQPSSRPPFSGDWPGIRFSSWNAGFQLEKRIPKTTFITAPLFRRLAGDPLFELECRIPARKADFQDNLHHGPPFQEIGRGSAFRAGMPDSSLKSGSPTQPSSRPPFSGDWPGVRFSSWNAGFQLEKRILKTTFITAPLFRRLAGDPLFELECRIPARKADPQDNLHHGPPFQEIGRGSAFRAGMPDASLKSGSPRQPSSRPPFSGDWPSWNAGFQLEKRIPKTTFITAPLFRRLAGDPLFELECRIPARKADPQDNLHHGLPFQEIGRGSAFRAGMPDSSSKSGSPRQPSSRPPFSGDWPGIRFSSWNAGFQLEKRIPKTTFITAPLFRRLAGDPLFELECRIPARKADTPRQPSSRPPFSGDWPGIRFSSWNAGFQLEKRIPKTTFITAPLFRRLAGDPLFELECRIPARKADPQDNLHHGPPFQEIGRGSAFRAGMPDSSSKSGSPRQPSSRPPFSGDWPGIRFSSWNAGFQLEKRIPKTTFITAPLFRRLAGDPLFELECRIPARKADPQDNLHHGPPFQEIGRGSAFRAGMPDSSSKSGSPRQPSSRPPFSGDWPGIRFSSWNAGFQLEKRIPKTTFITAPLFRRLAGDPLFELECRIPARKADPQDNLHHGPPFQEIGRGSAFRAGMPDSSSKSGSPRQPSSRPPFSGDWPGIRFSSWNAGFSSKSGSSRQPSSRPPFSGDWPGIRFSSWSAGFQLKKRIPKTTFITAPLFRRLAGDPLFELECQIPARKADPQDNLHHGPPFQEIGRGSAFRAGMPDSSSKSGSPRQPSSRPPFSGDWPGIRFSSWNAGFQLEKRIPKTTFITAPLFRRLAGDPLFELECRIPARKADPQDNLHHGPPFQEIGRGSAFRAGMPDSSSKSGSPRQPSSRPPFSGDWPGTRFSSWNAGFQLEKRIPKITFITAPLFRRLAGDPLFELEIRIPARKADPQDNLHHGPPFQEIGRGSAFRAGMPDSSSKSGSPRQPSSRPPFSGDWPGIWNAGFQLEKRHGPPFQEIGRGSAFRAGMPDSSSKSGSPRQPSSRPPFSGDWPGIRFSSWNAGFQLEKRIPKTTFITAPFELECRIPARKADLAGDPLFEWVTSVIRSLPTQKRLRPQDPLSQWSRPFSAFDRGLGFECRRDNELVSGPGSAFRAGIRAFQLEKRIPKTTFIAAFSGIRFSS